MFCWSTLNTQDEAAGLGGLQKSRGSWCLLKLAPIRDHDTALILRNRYVSRKIPCNTFKRLRSAYADVLRWCHQSSGMRIMVPRQMIEGVKHGPSLPPLPRLEYSLVVACTYRSGKKGLGKNTLD